MERYRRWWGGERGGGGGERVHEVISRLVWGDDTYFITLPHPTNLIRHIRCLDLLSFLAGVIDPGGHEVEEPYCFSLFQGDVNLSKEEAIKLRQRRGPVRSVLRER